MTAPNMQTWRKRKLSLVIWRNGAERIIPYSRYRVEPAANGNGLAIWETMPYGGKRWLDPKRILRRMKEA